MGNIKKMGSATRRYSTVVEQTLFVRCNDVNAYSVEGSSDALIYSFSCGLENVTILSVSHYIQINTVYI